MSRVEGWVCWNGGVAGVNSRVKGWVGEWESGGNGKLIFSGAGGVMQPLYSHIPGSLGHARFEQSEGEPVIVFVLLAI